MSSNWGILQSVSKVVGLNKNKDDVLSSSSKTPRRPSIPGRSSIGPRLSASSLMLAGIKDSNDESNKNTNNYITNKSNPLHYKNNNVNINDISVSVKSVSPSLKSKSNNILSELKQDASVVMKEVTVVSGSVGSELVGLRTSIYSQRNQQWNDGIILSFNADRHRICLSGSLRLNNMYIICFKSFYRWLIS